MRRQNQDVWIGSSTPEEDCIPDHFLADEIVQALSPLVTPERLARIQSVLDARIDSVTIVVDGLHDPYNGAAILRSADAFGIQTVHALEWHEPLAVSRGVSRGSQKWVNVIRHPNVDACVSTLLRQEYKICATHPKGELLPEDLTTLNRVALVLGNEGLGISPSLRSACTHTVRIPMVGFVESLNVSVSAALLSYAATRNRSGDLDSRSKLQALARALWLTVNHPAECVETWKARSVSNTQ